MSRPAAVALAGLLTVGAAQAAWSFELLRVDDNPCGMAANLFWPAAAAPVDPRFAGGLDRQEIVTTAMNRWNEVATRFRFRPGSGTVCDSGDGVVTVAFADSSCAGAPLGDVLAVTVFRFDAASGRLANAEVTLNAGQVVLQRDDALLLEVVMHELGHVLGLDHSDACGRSGAGTLMKTSILLGAPRLDRPQADDADGVNFVYPAERVTEVTGDTNSCALVPGSPAAWGLLVAGAVLLAAARRGRTVAG